MSGDVVPRPVRNWFRGTYPTLVFEESWLTQCCEYLQTHFDLSPPQLIKKVENQLLLSDLSTSTSPDPSPLAATISIDLPFGELPKEIILPNRAILVQIQSITEIGHSAIALETVHLKRLNEAEGRDRVLDLEDGEGTDRQAPVVFPRTMLRLELSDGHQVVQAIEHQRIDGLNLDETPLGCKLLIKSVRVRRGILLLSPENTIIKEFRVDELDSHRDRLFQEGLDRRLGRIRNEPMVAEAPQEANDAPQAINPATRASGTTTTASIVNTHNTNSLVGQTNVIDLSDSDDYFDDNSEFEDQLLAHSI